MSLRRILSGPDRGADLPLHDTAASREAEARALQALPPRTLMQAAGLSLARLTLALHPTARRVIVIAGPGNNGGDGLVAATHLQRTGAKPVQVVLLADPQRQPADAAWALQGAGDAGVSIVASCPASLDRDAVVIDALFGLGLRRAPDDALAEAMTWMNGHPGPVLSVDLPTGLHADSGVAIGGHAVRASATLSLLTLKPGLFTGAGRDHAGQVWFDDLGVSAPDPTALLCVDRQHSATRLHGSHKGSYGDVVVVGGAAGMVGAAWLAASAALCAGAGRVYLDALDPRGAAALAPLRPELMQRQRWWLSPPPLLAASTVVCGCGGGEAVREALPALLAHAGRLVLDADALNAVAGDSQLQALLSARAPRGLGSVLTPHPLEAARLLQRSTADVQADRIGAAQALARRWQCVVVLKGSGSVVAVPSTAPTIIGSGNPLLATPGTGDVLAGWIGGRWAQGGDALAATIESAWRHGDAADRAASAGRRLPLPASELVLAMACTQR